MSVAELYLKQPVKRAVLGTASFNDADSAQHFYARTGCAKASPSMISTLLLVYLRQHAIACSFRRSSTVDQESANGARVLCQACRPGSFQTPASSDVARPKPYTLTLNSLNLHPNPVPPRSVLNPDILQTELRLEPTETFRSALRVSYKGNLILII